MVLGNVPWLVQRFDTKFIPAVGTSQAFGTFPTVGRLTAYGLISFCVAVSPYS